MLKLIQLARTLLVRGLYTLAMKLDVYDEPSTEHEDPPEDKVTNKSVGQPAATSDFAEVTVEELRAMQYHPYGQHVGTTEVARRMRRQ